MEHKHNQHPHHHKPKKGTHHYYLILAGLVVLVVAGVHLWRKYKSNPMICREICFSTTEDENCSAVCIKKDEIKK